jgi:hypothetical protein
MLKFLTVLFLAAEGSIAMVMLVEEVKTREVWIERWWQSKASGGRDACEVINGAKRLPRWSLTPLEEVPLTRADAERLDDSLGEG